MIKCSQLVNGIVLIYREVEVDQNDIFWTDVCCVSMEQRKPGAAPQPYFVPFLFFRGFVPNEMIKPLSDDKIIITYEPDERVVSVYIQSVNTFTDWYRQKVSGIVSPDSAAGKAVLHTVAAHAKKAN